MKEKIAAPEDLFFLKIILFNFNRKIFLNSHETPYLKVRRDLTWEKFNARMSEYFGVSDGTFRIWMFKRKQISTHDSDHEVWRPEPVDEDDVDRPIYSVRRSLFKSKLNLNSHPDEWSL